MPSWSELVANPAEYVIYTTSILVALGVLYAAARRVGAFTRRITHTLDDLTGEPERPGVRARPGVMERLSSIEQRLDEVEGTTRQLRPNGGSHLADAIARIETAVTTTRPPDEP